MMKPLATQFEERALGSAVATPTCSSCCCCCCCVGTVAASSTVVATRVNLEIKTSHPRHRALATTAAALLWPLSVGVAFVISAIVIPMLEPCGGNISVDFAHTDLCSGVDDGTRIVFMLPALFLVAYALFRWSGSASPGKHALVIALAMIASFVAEFYLGMIVVLFVLFELLGGFDSSQPAGEEWYWAGLALYLLGSMAVAYVIARAYGKRVRATIDAPALTR